MLKNMRLRGRLLLQIGLALSLLWGAVAVWMQRDLEAKLSATLDQRLVMAAQMVADLVALNPKAWVGAPTQSDYLLPPRDSDDGLVCQISDLRGEVYARSSGSTQAGLRPSRPGFSEHWVDGQQWRSYTLAHLDMLVTTSDRMATRQTLLQQIMIAATLPFVIALLGGLLLLWIGVGAGLRPLERLRQHLAGRVWHDLTPVQDIDLPPDLQPLVGALNEMLERINLSLARERRFTADAAHELRTPLTAIKLHLQVLGLSDGRAAQQALNHANEGVSRLQQVLEQLLTLAEVEGQADNSSESSTEHAALSQVIQQALRDSHGLAPERLRISGEPGFEALSLALPQALAVTALRNLLDNAQRHSPANSMLDLSISCSDDCVELTLSDQGPGMSDEDISRATERFWRRSQGPGSGLGLSIVRAIAERFGGSLTLSRPPAGGLAARLRLPLAKLPLRIAS